jgi:hypothetical protein
MYLYHFIPSAPFFDVDGSAKKYLAHRVLTPKNPVIHWLAKERCGYLNSQKELRSMNEERSNPVELGLQSELHDGVIHPAGQ